MLTGASGFLGSYIKNELVNRNYDVLTLGRKHADIIADLDHTVPIINKSIEYVVHAAGKAHMVPKTEAEAKMFFDTNMQGTKNLLKSLEHHPLKAFVFISSVAVYGAASGVLIEESAPLAATDPYGKSKIEAEILIQEFCNKKQIHYSILRLPLIAGKNPPGNLGAMIKAIKKGWYMEIGNANNKKSVVLASDVAVLIPNLFEHSGCFNLSDGVNPTFGEIAKAITTHLGKKNTKRIPQFIAVAMAKCGDLLGKKAPINSHKLKKIQSELTFSDALAKSKLAWKPRSVIANIDQIL